MNEALNSLLERTENQGIEKGKEEVAANMIKAGFEDRQIAQLTSMPQQEVEAKRKSMQFK